MMKEIPDHRVNDTKEARSTGVSLPTSATQDNSVGCKGQRNTEKNKGTKTLFRAKKKRSDGIALSGKTLLRTRLLLERGNCESGEVVS